MTVICVSPPPLVQVKLPRRMLLPASLKIEPFALLVVKLIVAGRIDVAAAAIETELAVAGGAVGHGDRLGRGACRARCCSWMRSAPEVMVTPPVKLFAPLSTMVPALIGQSIVMPPVPLMSLGTSSVPVRSKRSVALLITSPAGSVPVAPSLPICKVPPLIVVRAEIAVRRRRG